jgi:hypothetical protein
MSSPSSVSKDKPSVICVPPVKILFAVKINNNNNNNQREAGNNKRQMEAISLSETWVDSQWTTQRYISEDATFHLF